MAASHSLAHFRRMTHCVVSTTEATERRGLLMNSVTWLKVSDKLYSINEHIWRISVTVWIAFVNAWEYERAKGVTAAMLATSCSITDALRFHLHYLWLTLWSWLAHTHNLSVSHLLLFATNSHISRVMTNDCRCVTSMPKIRFYYSHILRASCSKQNVGVSC